EMVLQLTKKKDSGSEQESQISSFLEKVRHLRDEFIKDIDRDANAFAEVMEAYRLPKKTESEKNMRREAIEMALKEAARIPMEVAENAYQLFELSQYIVRYGNRNAITDSATSAVMARGAVLSALYNVRINIASIKDNNFTEEMKKRATHLEEETIKKEREILGMVDSIMAKEG
ncbi:MAG TPA: cyclodeaminase/cyclohydrolase family protein, partial [Syntrophorhabdaceae bacterium]|nr:cyclodeaminase/cyclohydrolase family protein [Syntrophorhabdaceae bacterium]